MEDDIGMITGIRCILTLRRDSGAKALEGLPAIKVAFMANYASWAFFQHLGSKPDMVCHSAPTCEQKTWNSRPGCGKHHTT